MTTGENSTGNGSGPCGACKFLRRKCVKGCVFAPYFDSDQGMAHFAAVHKVFGASNASKLLLRIPVHDRVDAVVTLCYEALARIRDPVYGCVGHIFTLQQQVVNLQAELAYIRARLSTLQHLTSPLQLPRALTSPPAALPSTDLHPSPGRTTVSELASNTTMPTQFDSVQLHHPLFGETANFGNNAVDQELDDAQLHALAREFICRYLPGARLNSSRKNF